MNKIAICGIFIGPYCEMFGEFYRTLNEKFCTDCDRTFFIFTDNPELTKGIGNCKTYLISNACHHYGFILYRKFKYLMMAEDAFLGYDYVVFLNGNATCVDSVTFDEIRSPENGVSVAWHPCKLTIKGQNFDQSACSFRSEEERKYFQAGIFFMPTSSFMKLANQIEAWRMQDKADGKSWSVPWHDESYYNAYLVKYDIPINETPFLKFNYPEGWSFDQSSGKPYPDGCKIMLRKKTGGVSHAKGRYRNFKNDLY